MTPLVGFGVQVKYRLLCLLVVACLISSYFISGSPHAFAKTEQLLLLRIVLVAVGGRFVPKQTVFWVYLGSIGFVVPVKSVLTLCLSKNTLPLYCLYVCIDRLFFRQFQLLFSSLFSPKVCY